MGQAVSLDYIVRWLNYQLKAGLPLQSLIEMRVVVPASVEKAAIPEFPLVAATDPGDPDGPCLFGFLSFVSSLARSAGHLVVAHWDNDTDVLTHFTLVETAAYAGHPVTVIQ